MTSCTGLGVCPCVVEKKNMTGITLPRKSHFYMVQILICKHSVSGCNNHLKMGFEARVLVGITYGCPPECGLKAAAWALELEMFAAPLPEPHCPGQKSFCCSGSRLPPWNGGNITCIPKDLSITYYFYRDLKVNSFTQA